MMLKSLVHGASFVRQLSILPVSSLAGSGLQQQAHRGMATPSQPDAPAADQSTGNPTPAGRSIVVAVGDAREASSAAVSWALGHLVRSGECRAG